ncbi:MAG: hypothetical protein II854_03840 [Prevotella sp.]|nr:hypothetical protein [Prevotella sp.]
MKKKQYQHPHTEAFPMMFSSPLALSVDKGGQDSGYGEPEARHNALDDEEDGGNEPYGYTRYVPWE